MYYIIYYIDTTFKMPYLHLSTNQNDKKQKDLINNIIKYNTKRNNIRYKKNFVLSVLIKEISSFVIT